MAKLKINALVPDSNNFLEPFDGDVAFGNHSASSATFLETSGDGDYYVLKGRGFSYDGSTLLHGTITSVTFFNSEGVSYAQVTGLALNAARLERNPDIDLGDLMEKAMRGADRVLGSAGDDFLIGFAGNDVFTGGKGSDRFYCDSRGNDVITDFDAKGGGDEQDYVSVGAGGTTVRDGKNTVYQYENGHTLTFIGVRYTDLDVGDFIF